MHSDLSPYAHGGRVSAFLTGIGDLCVSGGTDGVIRVWRYGPGVGGVAGFGMVKECCGHVGEITGLVIIGGMLWSSSTDATLRLWDAGGGGSSGVVGTGSWECKYLITADTPPSSGAAQLPGKNGEVSGVGHSEAITALIPFECSAGNFVLSSSLDGDVKVWDGTNGECKSTTNHGIGVVCMAISSDKNDNPILLCGTVSGKIMVRMLLKEMRLLASLDMNYINVGHSGPVKQIKAGPGNTFYSVGSDGNLVIWQIMTTLDS